MESKGRPVNQEEQDALIFTLQNLADTDAQIVEVLKLVSDTDTQIIAALKAVSEAVVAINERLEKVERKTEHLWDQT